MAPVRVRGCVDQALLARGWPYRQADASRRRNGPRKSDGVARRLRLTITERLSSKSCPDREPDVLDHREKVSSGMSSGSELRPPQQASVGSKTRSDGRVPASVPGGVMQGPSVHERGPG